MAAMNSFKGKKGVEEVSTSFLDESIRDAVRVIFSSVREDKDSLSFQALCAHFESDAERCVEEDVGDGVLFSEGMISLLDRALELAALSELNLVELNAISNIEDVGIAVNALPRLWTRVLGVLFAEQRDPVNSAGLEQKLTLESLKAGEIDTQEGDISWRTRKKRAECCEGEKLVFWRLPRPSSRLVSRHENLLSIAANHSENYFTYASCEDHALKGVMAICTVLLQSHLLVNATQVEAATHLESTKWMMEPTLAAYMASSRKKR